MSARSVHVTHRQSQCLKQLHRNRQTAHCLIWRIHIVLLLSKGWGVIRVSRHVGKCPNTVRLWRLRWWQASELLEEAEEQQLRRAAAK